MRRTLIQFIAINLIYLFFIFNNDIKYWIDELKYISYQDVGRAAFPPFQSLKCCDKSGSAFDIHNDHTQKKLAIWIRGNCYKLHYLNQPKPEESEYCDIAKSSYFLLYDW